LAAKLLEEMNKQGWNQSLRQVSANEYYGLLKDAVDQEPPFQEVPEDERRKATEIEGDARELNKFFESKKTKVSDKMLFESWRRYLGK